MKHIEDYDMNDMNWGAWWAVIMFSLIGALATILLGCGASKEIVADERVSLIIRTTNGDMFTTCKSGARSIDMMSYYTLVRQDEGDVYFFRAQTGAKMCLICEDMKPIIDLDGKRVIKIDVQ